MIETHVAIGKSKVSPQRVGATNSIYFDWFASIHIVFILLLELFSFTHGHTLTTYNV